MTTVTKPMLSVRMTEFSYAAKVARLARVVKALMQRVFRGLT